MKIKGRPQTRPRSKHVRCWGMTRGPVGQVANLREAGDKNYPRAKTLRDPPPNKKKGLPIRAGPCKKVRRIPTVPYELSANFYNEKRPANRTEDKKWINLRLLPIGVKVYDFRVADSSGASTSLAGESYANRDLAPLEQDKKSKGCAGPPSCSKQLPLHPPLRTTGHRLLLYRHLRTVWAHPTVTHTGSRRPCDHPFIPRHRLGPVLGRAQLSTTTTTSFVVVLLHVRCWLLVERVDPTLSCYSRNKNKNKNKKRGTE